MHVGHGVAAGEIACGGLAAGFELVDFFAIPVVDLVAVAIDEDECPWMPKDRG